MPVISNDQRLIEANTSTAHALTCVHTESPALRQRRIHALNALRELEGTVLQRHEAIEQKTQALDRMHALEAELNALGRRKEQLTHQVDSQVRELERTIEITKARMAPLERNAQAKIETTRHAVESAHAKIDSAQSELDAAQHQHLTFEARLQNSQTELALISSQLAPLKSRFQEIDNSVAQTNEHLNAISDIEGKLTELQTALRDIPNWLRSLPHALSTRAGVSPAFARKLAALVEQAGVEAAITDKTFEQVRHVLAKSSNTAHVTAYCDKLQGVYKTVIDNVIANHQKHRSEFVNFLMLAFTIVGASYCMGRLANAVKPKPVEPMSVAWEKYEHQLNELDKVFVQDNKFAFLRTMLVAMREDLRYYFPTLINSAKNDKERLNSESLKFKTGLITSFIHRNSDQFRQWSGDKSFQNYFQKIIQLTENFLENLADNHFAPPVQPHSRAHSTAAISHFTLGVLGIGAVLFVACTFANQIRNKTFSTHQLVHLRNQLNKEIPKEVNQLLNSAPFKKFANALQRPTLTSGLKDADVSAFQEAVKKPKADLINESETLAARLEEREQQLRRTLEQFTTNRQLVLENLNVLKTQEHDKLTEHSQLNSQRQTALTAFNVAQGRLDKERANLDKQQAALASEQQRLEQDPRYIQWNNRLQDLQRDIQTRHEQRQQETEDIEQAHYPVVRELETLVAHVGELDELIQANNDELDARNHVVEQVYHDFVKPHVAHIAFERAVDRHVAVRDEELLNRVGLGVFVNGLGRTMQAASTRASSYYSMYHLLSASIEAAEQLAALPPLKSGRFYIQHDRPMGTTVSLHQHDVALPVSTTRVDFETTRHGERVITHINPCADEEATTG
ncbi:MAG TPA: hypothetical protein VFS42_12500 [Burkholderiaceae bacterium]|nr:hypothetical protein [Burkholderiaceae bacterium]